MNLTYILVQHILLALTLALNLVIFLVCLRLLVGKLLCLFGAVNLAVAMIVQFLLYVFTENYEK